VLIVSSGDTTRSRAMPGTTVPDGVGDGNVAVVVSVVPVAAVAAVAVGVDPGTSYGSRV